ncbi:MAG: hypothetical protein ACTHMA_02155 [Thermomicrobiales bacterium]
MTRADTAETVPGQPAAPRQPRTTGQPATARQPVRAAHKRRRRFDWRQWLAPRVQLPTLLIVTALAVCFAWQVRQPFALAVGTSDAAPYLTGFHDPETSSDGGLRYRWTQGDARVTIPGYGATTAMLTLRLQSGRPPGAPPPDLRITLGNGAPLSLPLEAGLKNYTVPVLGSAFQDGDLTVQFQSATFRPLGDARDLGIAVADVGLRDAGGAGGLVPPPLGALGALLLCVLAAYALGGFLLQSPLAGAAAGWCTAVGLLVFALHARFALSLFAPRLAATVAFGAALTLLTALVAWRLRERRGWSSARRILGGAALIAAVNFLALMLGMRHPQFRSSDLMLNVHRLEFVQRGEWIFTLPLPGPRAIEAPYPPLFYAVMLPVSWLLHDSVLLVEATAALAVAAGALLTFALARALTGADAPALWAAVVYTVPPVVYLMASAGNFANLFGQLPATAYLVALTLTYSHWRRPAVAAGLTILLILGFLGHFGVFLSLLVAVPLIAIALAVTGAEGRKQALALIASFAIALAAAYAMYYRFHTTLLLDTARDFLGGNLNARGGSVASSTPWQRLEKEWGDVGYYWGWLALPLGIGGAIALWRAHRSPRLLIALVWLATCLPFAAGDLVASVSVRYFLFVAPALGLAAGWALARTWRIHRLAGPLLSLLLCAAWAWPTLVTWTDRVLHAYH